MSFFTMPTRVPTNPTGSPDPPPRRPRRRAFDRLIALVLLALLCMVVYRYREPILGALYGPTALLVLIVAVVEFLVLQSMDRTRLYRIENKRLVRRRREDMKAMRETEAAIAHVLGEAPMPRGPSLPETDKDPEPPVEAAVMAYDKADTLDDELERDVIEAPKEPKQEKTQELTDEDELALRQSLYKLRGRLQ